MYRESADDVVGYLESVDLFVSELDTWAARVRPLPNLPESISASLALARMREADAELALVLDEYGETAGILTVRDILDEIAERETSFDRSGLDPAARAEWAGRP